MASEIKKFTFRSDINVEIEILSLRKLTKDSEQHLLAPHRTNFYHIFLFENCQPNHVVDFEPIKVKPNSLLFIDKDRVHQFDRLLDYEGTLLIFTDNFFAVSDNDTGFLKSSTLFNNPIDNIMIHPDTVYFKKYIELFRNIDEELNLPRDRSQHIILRNLVHNLLLIADREKQKQGHMIPKKSVDLDYTLLFRDLLETNYTKLKGVNDYAKFICITERRLGQATVNILGRLPKEIINDRILLEAKRLLVHTHLSVKEVGQKLGYEDPAYFVRYFKKNIKTTPVEFRASFLKN